MIIQGDALVTLKDITSETVDLIVTDPPYGISFMGKDWDKAIPSQEVWQECFRVLKQGKIAFVMCSARQDVLSRMIISLEDAGFKTGYSSIYWTYASGFPKAANVSKLIDKRKGATREIVGKKEYERTPYRADNTKGGHNPQPMDWGKEVNQSSTFITKPATEQAKKMEGAYVGFQPKPAVEIILVVSKGKTLTWLDDCRIPYQDMTQEPGYRPNYKNYNLSAKVFKGFSNDERTLPLQKDKMDQKGRFPANLLVSDDVLNDGKITKSTPVGFDKKKQGFRVYSTTDHKYDRFVNPSEIKEFVNYSDSGSYSRYFDLDKWYSCFPFIITPKASKSERNEGCEDLEKQYAYRQNGFSSKISDTKFATANNHPTVKPIKLMSYLITLGSRENDLVLDPFCGSGTTLIAAEQLRRKWLGIEINPEYIAITKERLLEETNQWKMDIFLKNT